METWGKSSAKVRATGETPLPRCSTQLLESQLTGRCIAVIAQPQGRASEARQAQEALAKLTTTSPAGSPARLQTLPSG